MKPSMLRFAIGILIGLHIGKFGCKIYQEQDVLHERRCHQFISILKIVFDLN